MRYLILCTLLLAGCSSLSPAVMGKTHYDVEFTDQTADQNTQYKMNIKAPAGVDLASVTGMTYDWKPDGSGAINVSQSGNVDTSNQAALIAEVSKQQVESLNMMLNALAPFLGQQIQSKDNRARIEAESDSEKLDRAVELLREILGDDAETNGLTPDEK